MSAPRLHGILRQRAPEWGDDAGGIPRRTAEHPLPQRTTRAK